MRGDFVVQGPCGCALYLFSHSWPDWEHVSVSTRRNRSPNWQEMCFVKDLFWDEEERVIQIHPPLSEYVKNDRWCLHLWKPLNAVLPAPPSTYVGVVGVGPDETYKIIYGIIEERMRAFMEAEGLQ